MSRGIQDLRKSEKGCHGVEVAIKGVNEFEIRDEGKTIGGIVGGKSDGNDPKRKT